MEHVGDTLQGFRSFVVQFMILMSRVGDQKRNASVGDLMHQIVEMNLKNIIQKKSTQFLEKLIYLMSSVNSMFGSFLFPFFFFRLCCVFPITFDNNAVSWKIH